MAKLKYNVEFVESLNALDVELLNNEETLVHIKESIDIELSGLIKTVSKDIVGDIKVDIELIEDDELETR
ncbi:hypothetical protein [Psychrobacillus phage Perkons]|nr:hypothetical protein [Psychrobacillus phage Perkons]